MEYYRKNHVLYDGWIYEFTEICEEPLFSTHYFKNF